MPKEANMISAAGICLVIFLAILFLFPLSVYPVLGIAGLALFICSIAMFRLQWGLYLLDAVSFFHGLEIAFADQPWAQNIQFLATLNAPLVDFIAVCLLAVFLVAFLLRLHPVPLGVLRQTLVPIFCYAVFLVVALVSARFAYEHQIGVSLKYVLRFLLFPFLSFLVLPVLLIESKQTLKIVCLIWFWVGVGVALFGLSSLAIIPGHGLPKLAPYSIGSIAPLGENHNLLAEVLIAIIPIGLYFSVAESLRRPRQFIPWRGVRLQRAYFPAGTALMMVVALLTLSRAAWISLSVEMIFALGFFWSQALQWCRDHAIATVVGALIVIGVVGYFFSFLLSHATASSTDARFATTQLVVFYADRAPFIGYGPGMYIDVLNDTAVYGLDYGSALDAHGFIQKVLLEEGGIGLALFFCTIGGIVYLIWQSRAETSADKKFFYHCMLVMTLGVVTIQLFNTSYFSSIFWMPLGVALASTRFVKENKLALSS